MPAVPPIMTTATTMAMETHTAHLSMLKHPQLSPSLMEQESKKTGKSTDPSIPQSPNLVSIVCVSLTLGCVLLPHHFVTTAAAILACEIAMDAGK
jgi:hypothetical protein